MLCELYEAWWFGVERCLAEHPQTSLAHVGIFDNMLETTKHRVSVIQNMSVGSKLPS